MRKSKPIPPSRFFEPLDNLPRSISDKEYNEIYDKCMRRAREHQVRVDGRVQGFVMGVATVLCVLGLVWGFNG